jgi:hypothetical protein
MKPLTWSRIANCHQFTNASSTKARSLQTTHSSVPYFSRLAIRHGMIQACPTPPALLANQRLMPDLSTTEALHLVMNNLCQE